MYGVLNKTICKHDSTIAFFIYYFTQCSNNREKLQRKIVGMGGGCTIMGHITSSAKINIFFNRIFFTPFKCFFKKSLILVFEASNSVASSNCFFSDFKALCIFLLFISATTCYETSK